jgi:hypothetical protein
MDDDASTAIAEPEVAPLAFDGDMTPVERDRTLFVAEDPAAGPYFRYDPGTGEFVERDAITADFLRDVAETSDPETGSIVNELGDTDYGAIQAIGHDEDKRLLHAANLPGAGDVRRVRFDEDTGKLDVRVQMPKQVADWQDAGLFPKVSARFYNSYPGVNKPALAHIALLGTMPPVKKNLGPWSPALFSDNAEGASAAAKKHGVRVVDMAKGDLVVEFAETSPADLRTRIMEKVQADAEMQLEFVAVDLATTAGVTPEEINRFLSGETDDLNDAARKALMRFAGIPTMDGAGAPAADGEGDGRGAARRRRGHGRRQEAADREGLRRAGEAHPRPRVHRVAAGQEGGQARRRRREAAR